MFSSVSAPATVLSLAILSLTVTASMATDGSPAQNNYTVTNDEITCIVMTTAMQLEIPYAGNSENKTAKINISNNSTWSGSCNNTQGENTLLIHLPSGWRLTVTFRTSGVNNSRYHWDDVTLTYVLEKKYFPDALNTSAGRTVCLTTILENTTYEGNVDGSYKCEGNSSLHLKNSILLKVTNLQYRAFGDSNETWFSSDNVTLCPTPDVDIGVAIAVGIALAAMLVVTVVLYFVVSKLLKRKR